MCEVAQRFRPLHAASEEFATVARYRAQPRCKCLFGGAERPVAQLLQALWQRRPRL